MGITDLLICSYYIHHVLSFSQEEDKQGNTRNRIQRKGPDQEENRIVDPATYLQGVARQLA
jgi:hypothetical protein